MIGEFRGAKRGLVSSIAFSGGAMSDMPGYPSDLSRRPGSSESPVARLSALWRHGHGPDLRAFLAGAGRLSAVELTDVLCSDQRQRWLHGQRPQVEAYIALHGSFHPGAEPAIDLIFGEFLARRELGESPTLDEYCRRFPGLVAQLRLHVGLYDALGEVRPARDDPASGPGGDPSTVSHAARTPAVASGRPGAGAPRGREAGAFESDYESFKRLLHGMDQQRSAGALLQLIVRRLAERPHVALARVWLVRPGDQCAACPARRSARTRRRACTWSPAPAGRSARRATGRGLMGAIGASPWECARSA